MQSEWDTYFASMLIPIAAKSKDPSSKYAAIIVSRDNTIRSTGYNGFPRGISYSPDRLVRPVKYKYTVHAEQNAIYNAARSGVSTLDCDLYTNHTPCVDCCRSIIQAGISQVNVGKLVYPEPPLGSESLRDGWRADIELSYLLLLEAGINLREMGA